MLGELTVIERVNASKSKSWETPLSSLICRWDFSWLFSKARENSRKNQHSERSTSAHSTLLVAVSSHLSIVVSSFPKFIVNCQQSTTAQQ